MGDGPAVVVAVVTYDRPADLRAALAAIAPEVAGAPGGASILVVDNGPGGGAVVPAAGPDVRVVHEPVPGIAAARNRALTEADGADLLVFVDDDERPRPGWLRALVGTWARTGAAAVAGPVVSEYPAEPEPWIARGGFFDRRRLPTGTGISVAATNNLLLDLAQVRRAGVRFDERFGESGGSDTLFTRALHRAGGRIVWCDEAVVVDVVPPSRLTRRWVLARAVRSGNSWSRTAVALEHGPIARAGRRLGLTAQGLVRLAGGAARLALGTLTRSLRHRARGLRTAARGAGMLAGAWGYTYAEYRRARPPALAEVPS